ncbi:MAG TPA: hypothetical protein VJ488_03175 [Dehalococcoidia bacterium]|nr:hypothetical protein [Dehalococcoidia bacterium]
MPLHEVIAPIFIGPDGVGVGVALRVGVGIALVVAVAVGVALNVGVVSSPPPPQAGSTISSNKLKTVNETNHRSYNISISSTLLFGAELIAFTASVAQVQWEERNGYATAKPSLDLEKNLRPDEERQQLMAPLPSA